MGGKFYLAHTWLKCDIPLFGRRERTIDENREGGGLGGMTMPPPGPPPRQNFDKLVNKNAKNGEP
jgi:hypothetical protein